MDYKETLCLPQTQFSMRGNLPNNEPMRYKQWKKNHSYNKMLTLRADATKSFYLHDGPPYANGHLHIGHALNKILKDIIIKFHYFNGEKIAYTPGWDCHGLPIEQQVEKALGREKKQTLSTKEIRALCREHAAKFVKIQSDEFESLGVLGDFDNPYKTMDFKFEADIYRTLIKVIQNGLLAQRNKPIYWSWACQTALADAEVEYQDKQSDSVFVAFNLDKEALAKLGIEAGAMVIWTTTPWTLPANVAIALNPKASYVLTKNGYIVAKALHEKMVENGVVDSQIIGEFDAKNLENLNAINPLNNRSSRLILGEHVSLDDGTGAVHTATGHGEEDYYVGLKYNLEVLMPVDDYGCYDQEIIQKKLLPESFLGKHIFKAQDEILKLLGTSLLKHQKITHSYPHCWRSHEPVIYRATTQWFILMDKPIEHGEAKGKTLRQIALEEIDKTIFYPDAGRNRIRSMVENRPDWCISRQRDWGVPIAIFYNKKTGEHLFDSKVLEFIANRFEKEGCDIWWSEDIKSLLPKDYEHLAGDLEKGMHILDVWFESGSTWNAVLKNSNNTSKYEAGEYPADMYLEGSDQHRGWFQSSLLLSCAINGHAPFKSVLTHGFTVDEKGEKMSKSKGNVIAPENVLKTQGSEILRLWVGMNDYHSDLKISSNILTQVSEQYRKLRNTIRFLLANINDLENLASFEEMSEIDAWILNVSADVFERVRGYFSQYDFVKGLQILMHYVANELSGIYMDLCKDSLYCDDRDSRAVRASKSAMLYIARNLMHILAPILTYSIDEAIEFAPDIFKKAGGGEIKDVFELTPLEIKKVPLKQNFDFLLALRSKFGEVIDHLKKEKIIKSSLEACIVSQVDFDDLDKWLIISQALKEVNNKERLASFEVDGMIFELYYADGHKCPRCWRYLASIEDGLCERCKEVIR